MLFYSFHSQEERRTFGGSAFIELQFCKLPTGTKIKKLVSTHSIKDWMDDSLYVNEENIFLEEYSHIFDCGTYNNLQSGTVDIFGINYYASALTDSIIDKLEKLQPLDYEVLLDWLNKSKAHNGFYILGI